VEQVNQKKQSNYAYKNAQSNASVSYETFVKAEYLYYSLYTRPNETIKITRSY